MDSWLACHEFEPSSIEDPSCRGAMDVKSVESSNVLPLRPSGRAVAYRASPPQVKGLFMGWARSTQPFIPTAVGR
ncbi:hypothetical protein TNCV_780991 [Trichonephila clavipes]|nr:hypothetical protein TNCV_780991 [Trichonephila clavipes]